MRLNPYQPPSCADDSILDTNSLAPVIGGILAFASASLVGWLLIMLTFSLVSEATWVGIAVLPFALLSGLPAYFAASRSRMPLSLIVCVVLTLLPSALCVMASTFPPNGGRINIIPVGAGSVAPAHWLLLFSANAALTSGIYHQAHKWARGTRIHKLTSVAAITISTCYVLSWLHGYFDT